MRVSRLLAAGLAGLLAATAAPAAFAHRQASTPWDKLEATAAGRVRPAVLAGVSALRIEVRPGDSPTSSGERTEMVWSPAHSQASEGQTVTYRWMARFPAGFRYVPSSTWNIFTQFHETAADGCHPNLALQIDARPATPMLRLQVRGGALDASTCEPQSSPSWDVAPLLFDHWYAIALRVTWSADPAVGSVALTIDGRTVTSARTATLYEGQGAYLKQGFYRDASPLESVLYQTTPVIQPLSSAASRRR